MVKPAESAVPNLALSDLRDAQGWSQEEEADRLNELARAKGLPDTITATAVSRWERGIVEVPIPMHRQLLAELVGVFQQETGPLRPLVAPQRRYDRYHKAMRDLDRPRLFDNRVCYRLLEVEQVPAREAATLTFGHMRYFDMIDVGEALAHELARTYLNANGTLRTDQPSWEDLPFRRLLGDPFALHAYPLLLSISTLTIRRSHAGATFVLLRRNPERVAIAGGLLSVMPTGVFQPACILSTEDCPDFDLWCNMMREYSEEFL